jgi:peptide alpha-N-acetyltransferase
MDVPRLAQLPGELSYIQYQHSLEAKYLPAIRALISKDLSEPYSIYVYRYFLYQWAHLCFMVSMIASGCLVSAEKF